MGFVIDTSVWIEVERGSLSPGDVASLTGKEPVFLSPVTIAELRYGVEAASSKLKVRRQAALNRLKNKPVLPIDEGTGDIFGTLAYQLKKSGRDHKFRVQDLWIASQAIQNGCKVLTLDGSDFKDIPGLETVVIKGR